MKKLLISTIIILVSILTITTLINGIHIGKIDIIGVKEIKKENANLEEKLQQATTLVSTEYPNKVSTLNSDLKEMKNEKTRYEDMIATSTESEVAAALQKQKYSIDKLWTKLGSLATDEGLDAKFEFKNGSLASTDTSNSDYKYYDINFTVQGSYVGVSLYISDLENDSELNFKIENFSMEPNDSGETVKATFVTKDIAIKGISGSSVPTTQDTSTN